MPAASRNTAAAYLVIIEGTSTGAPRHYHAVFDLARRAGRRQNPGFEERGNRMNRANTLACVVSMASLAVAGIARGEESKKPAQPAVSTAEASAAAPAAPAPPKVGPEHAQLRKEAGVWDATVEMSEAPGQKPQISQGTETATLIANGLWLVSDFKADFGGQPFEGHGVTGYDPAKKKYVGTWVDTWSTALGTSEGTFDPATKKSTAYMDAPDMTGKMIKMKMETEWKDDDTRVFTMWSPGPDGKSFPGLKITYKRRK
jgi:hypothetical protein